MKGSATPGRYRSETIGSPITTEAVHG